MLKGEIKPRFFKVSFLEATNSGFEPSKTKYFKKHQDAEPYALNLVKDLESIAEESDDCESIQIENEKDEVLALWRAENGKVVFYRDR